MSTLERLNRIAEKLYTDGNLTAENLEPFFSRSDRLLLIADADGISVAVNPMWKTELGYEPRQIEGTPYLELVHPDDRDATQAAAASLTEDNVANFRNRYRSAGGDYKWLSWTASRYDEGRLTYASAHVVRDPEELATLSQLADERSRRAT